MKTNITRAAVSIVAATIAGCAASLLIATVATDRGYRAWQQLASATSYWHRPAVETAIFSLCLSIVSTVVVVSLSRSFPRVALSKSRFEILAGFIGCSIALTIAAFLPGSAAWGFKFQLFPLLGIISAVVPAAHLHRAHAHKCLTRR